MIINTGFGYYVKDGKKLHKYELPKGEHPDPIGYTFIEVANQEELDTIILDKSDEQILLEKSIDMKRQFKEAAIKKLVMIGLSNDEVNALIR